MEIMYDVCVCVHACVWCKCVGVCKCTVCVCRVYMYACVGVSA